MQLDKHLEFEQLLSLIGRHHDSKLPDQTLFRGQEAQQD